MTRTIALFTLVAALALPVALGAHEGHEHTVMGTVQKIEGTTLVVKAVDAKTKAETTVTIVLGDKSELVRGVAAVTAADIKPGERLVVRYVTTKSTDGKETHTAKQVRLAEATSSIDPSMSRRLGDQAGRVRRVRVRGAQSARRAGNRVEGAPALRRRHGE